MLERSTKSNLLEPGGFKYSLQDIPEPNLYRDQFPYDEVPKLAFNHRRVPMNMPEDIWITDNKKIALRLMQSNIVSFTKTQIGFISYKSYIV